MKFAVIKTGGKQYLVTEGKKVKIEKLNSKEGDRVEFDQVLVAFEGGKVELGMPGLTKKVIGKVLVQGKGNKVRVEKYKPKVRYHKVYGHRQPFTEVEIEKIG